MSFSAAHMAAHLVQLLDIFFNHLSNRAHGGKHHRSTTKEASIH